MNTASGVKAIYHGQAPVIKGPFYDGFAPEHPSSFSANGEIYKNKKKVLLPAFAPSKLQAYEKHIRTYIDEFCNHLATQKEVDLSKSLSGLTVDILSDLCFGKSLDLMGDNGRCEKMLNALEAGLRLTITVSFACFHSTHATLSNILYS